MITATHWVYLIDETMPNINKIPDPETIINDMIPITIYHVIGRKKNWKGIKSLLGYIVFNKAYNLHQVKQLCGLEHAHWEICKCSPMTSSSYTTKRGDYIEHGDILSFYKTKE